MTWRVSGWLLATILSAAPKVVAAQVSSALPFEVVKMSADEGQGTRLFARNLSHEVVALDSIHITACLNLPRALCASHAVGLALPVDPSLVEIFRVVPLRKQDDYRFRASYSWHISTEVAETTTVLITPEGKLTIRSEPASPFALLGLSKKLAIPEDSLRRVGRGVWVYDVQVGTGDSATAGQRVDLHHVGMFVDGRIFTQTGRKPFSFTLGEGKVIDGWEDGVLGMRVGGRRKLVIPSELGYGPKGDGAIPPGAVLVFDVTLVGVR